MKRSGDLIESKSFGCDYIIAPMIETEYALQKFVEARFKTYLSDDHTKFLFNLETTTAYQNRESLFKLAATNLDGCVFGRVDYTGSLGMSRDSINDDVVTDDVCSAASLADAAGVDMVVGGGVSMTPLQSLRRIRDVKLSRFETRKIIFLRTHLTCRVLTRAYSRQLSLSLIGSRTSERFMKLSSPKTRRE